MSSGSRRCNHASRPPRLERECVTEMAQHRSVEVHPRTCPDCPRRARRDRVFMGALARVGAEDAIRAEGVGAQEPRGEILLVQYVYDTGEKINRLSEAPGALQINDRIARNPSRAGRRDVGAGAI